MIPFSSAYTVYPANDSRIPAIVAEQVSNAEPIHQVIVCLDTQAFITSYIQDNGKKTYYTLVCNMDITGSLEQCISFLQKNLN